MIEIDEYGAINGSFWIGIIFFVAGLESSSFSYKLKDSMVESRISMPRFSMLFTKKFILIVSSFVVILSIFVIFQYSSPVLLRLDRVTFWNDYVPSFLSRYPSLVGQSFFFAAFYYRIAKKNKQNILIPKIIICCYVFFTFFVSGEKFSTFIIYIFMWSVLVAGFETKIKVKWKDYFVVLSLLGGLFLIVFLSYLRADKEAVFILARIALQAQLLWSVCNENLSTLIAGTDWKLFFGGVDFKDGIDFISSRYLPPSLYHAYLNSGSNLSGFLPALPILTFGLPVALLLHIFISFFFGFFQVSLIRSIRNVNFVYSFILFKIYFALILIWYAAKFMVIPGLAIALVIAGIYRILPTKSKFIKQS